MISRKKILIICPDDTVSYVHTDIALTGEVFDVDMVTLREFRVLKKPSLIAMVFWKFLWTQVDLVCLRFSIPAYAPFVVLLSKLFGKKVVIITNGFDVTFVPDTGFGEMGSWWKRLFQSIALRYSDVVLPPSDYSKTEVLQYGRPKMITTLYDGIDTDYFAPNPHIVREEMVMTVAAAVAHYSMSTKGVVTLIAVAKAMPDIQFVIVGRVLDDAKDEVAKTGKNVLFVGRLSDEALLQYYQRAKVYAQLSRHEAFGVANVEAMSSGCASVVTPVTALPEIVGNAGLYVPFGDVAASVIAIREALKRDDLREAARSHVLDRFTLAHRKQGLVSNFMRLIDAH
ncbi:MAG: glycosyltransferase family 4 protein [Rhizobacter sp.]|nr:glycosyltransferase family 4 protein [Chlorobiales bacterium]